MVLTWDEAFIYDVNPASKTIRDQGSIRAAATYESNLTDTVTRRMGVHTLTRLSNKIVN